MNASNSRKPHTGANGLALVGLLILPLGTWWLTRTQAAWIAMWSIAVTEFVALKVITLVATESGPSSFGRKLAYLVLWPGMDAKAFLNARSGDRPDLRPSELVFAFVKMAAGLIALYWAVCNVARGNGLLVAWVGMIGIIFTLHFGLLHLISWLWRRAGMNAPPIMRAPILADSLADFWGGRWNAAFADAARRFIFRPTVRQLGVSGAGGLVFLVSGLVHESVISLPARGGWGGPTAYFLIQGAGIAVEKSGFGKKLGLGKGMRGWAWTIACTATPVMLLFHVPFVHRVILPFLEALKSLLP